MIWIARAAWILLPAGLGGALDGALDGWSRAPAAVAVTAAWAAWAAALLALLAPRPWGYTLLRVAAASLVAVAIATVPSLGAGAAVLVVAHAVVAAAAAVSSAVAHAAANGAAYGDEVRFPLRAPLALAAGPIALAAAIAGAGAAAGPLLLASGRVGSGVAALLAGGALTVLLTRALHGLARRWVVLVPAGLVVADPLTLLDPVLVVHDTVAGIRRHRDAAVPPGAADLRLGTLPGGVQIRFTEPVPLPLRRGAGTDLVRADSLLVAPLRPGALLAAAAAHRLRSG